MTSVQEEHIGAISVAADAARLPFRLWNPGVNEAVTKHVSSPRDSISFPTSPRASALGYDCFALRAQLCGNLSQSHYTIFAGGVS